MVPAGRTFGEVCCSSPRLGPCWHLPQRVCMVRTGWCACLYSQAHLLAGHWLWAAPMGVSVLLPTESAWEAWPQDVPKQTATFSVLQPEGNSGAEG